MAPSMPLPSNPSLHFRLLPAGDVRRAAELETASYPADEAATPEKLEYRQRVAPELFYGVYEGGSTLVGFVVSTAANGKELEEETMSTHSPGGESICIHSVCVAASHRRRGIARDMVRLYVDAVLADTERCGKAQRMLLLAHSPLIGLYAQCGFEFIGPSKVEHGGELWYDMRLDLAARRQLDFFQVDAFTPAALAGNPAAVLFTQNGGAEAWMQAVAIENNLSETAFLEPRQAAGHWDIRWFTPGAEVDLCGHATLGSAHALWDSGRTPKDMAITFHTLKAGTLHCRLSDDWICMEFPAQPPSEVSLPSSLAAAFGFRESDVLYVGRGPKATPDWLLEVSPTAFASMKPDSSAICSVPQMDRGVIVTCAGAVDGSSTDDNGAVAAPARKRPRVLGRTSTLGPFDFTSRFFAPKLGIEEDPVTGSAHCVLAPYWSAKLGKGDGAQMTALQASSRGGVLRVRVSGDRVEIEGQAVTVLKGKMAV